MERKPLTIHIDLDWRVLVTLAVLVTSVLAVYFVAGAQGGDPPSTNDPGAIPLVPPAQDAPPAVPQAGQPPAEGMLPTTNGEWLWPDQVSQADPEAAGDMGAAAAAGARHFYLTMGNYSTNQVLTACAPGYHMASLWEILDVSNLTYDDTHPAAYTKTDSGEGPPSSWFGWVRTGYDSSSSSTTGSGNCNNWTSTSNTAYGVAVRLSSTWETAPGDIATWDATSFPCGSFGPVWCVGN